MAKKPTTITSPAPINTTWPAPINFTWPAPITETLVVASKKGAKGKGR